MSDMLAAVSLCWSAAGASSPTQAPGSSAAPGSPGPGPVQCVAVANLAVRDASGPAREKARK